ncbi:hypothetical protein [Bartonella sp. AU18XJBT]|uniref:hypothetical protein n=1 Tax=Bartonella sp. AU18XJBT TaxID=3019089 RepID=UPI00235E6960|nr:hypothetical protein [Bartonella sp. AU18XJBT]
MMGQVLLYGGDHDVRYAFVLGGELGRSLWGRYEEKNVGGMRKVGVESRGLVGGSWGLI